MTTTMTESPPALKWHAKGWVRLLAVGIVAFVVGSIVGGSSAGTPKTELDAANKRASQAEARATQAEQQAAQAQASAQADLAKQKAALDAQSARLDAREKKIAGAEVAAKANTFDGDGVYIVGQDVQPGTYKSAGGDHCYWARKTKGGEIIDNHLGSGPTVVVISASDFSIDVNNCQPFTKSGA